MPRKQANSETWESLRMNNLTYQYYYNKMFELAISRYEYKNMPEEIDTRYLEITEYTRGGVCFFKEPVLNKFATLPFANNYELDMYGNPIRWRAYGVNGYNINLDDSNSVIIYNNLSRTPNMRDIEMFAMRLYRIDRALDTNINTLRTPVVVVCDEDTRLSMKNLMMQYDGNIPFIYGNKKLNLDDIRVLDLKCTYNGDKLYTLKNQIWNEFLTSVGISNVSFQKKERLVSDEVLRSMGGTVSMRQSGLAARQYAVEKINKMFGLNIEVSFRDSIDEITATELSGSITKVKDDAEEGEPNE